MVKNIMDVAKTTGSTRTSQAQKSKKAASDDKSAFGQALTDAAGAANSANAPAERQTYDQKDAPKAEKDVESVQVVQETSASIEQMLFGEEGIEGQDVLASLMQMGTDEIQANVTNETSWEENMTRAVQDGTKTSDIVSRQPSSGAIKDLPQEFSEEDNVSVEDLLAEITVTNDQTEAKEQQAAADMGLGERAATSESAEEEHSVVDISAEAAADKSGMSYIQLQSNNDSSVIEAQVEVTETGEIKSEYANMLKDMIAKQLSNGRQEFEISLTPRNLGALLIKVAHEAGETTVSIICSNAKAMQAMSSKASELGSMLESTLGDKMEVVVEDKSGQQSNFYDEGRNDSGAQAQKEEQERRHEENRRRMEQEAGSADFLQQLRLGLA